MLLTASKENGSFSLIVFATLGNIRSWMLYSDGKGREEQNKGQVESKHSPLSAGTRLRKAEDRTQC